MRSRVYDAAVVYREFSSTSCDNVSTQTPKVQPRSSRIDKIQAPVLPQRSRSFARPPTHAISMTSGRDLETEERNSPKKKLTPRAAALLRHGSITITLVCLSSMTESGMVGHRLVLSHNDISVIGRFRVFREIGGCCEPRLFQIDRTPRCSHIRSPVPCRKKNGRRYKSLQSICCMLHLDVHLWTNLLPKMHRY